MNKRFAAMSVAMAACSALVIGVAGQGTGQELQLVTRAAGSLRSISPSQFMVLE